MSECPGIANSEICHDEEESKEPLMTMENEGELWVAAGKLRPYVEVKVINLIFMKRNVTIVIFIDS
jgi:hypothetical protein